MPASGSSSAGAGNKKAAAATATASSSRASSSLSLSIDTKTLQQLEDRGKSPSVTTKAFATAQDNHPYQRGAVIEVWHIPKKVAGENDDDDDDDDDWWSEDDDDEEEEDQEDAMEQEGDANQNNSNNKNNKQVLLCDIIDRAPTKNDNNYNSSSSSNNVGWKYYVHYRGLNRRMDEWIPVSRIVSPPSVGNAKARALKRQEEKKRKLQLLQELERQQQQQSAEGAAVRSRRRSAVVMEAQQQQQAQQQAANQRGQTPVAGTAASSAADGAASTAGRRKRLSRRRSTMPDDEDSGADDNDPLNTSTTSAADGAVAGGAGKENASTAAATNKSTTTATNHHYNNKGEIVAADAAVTTMTVGEHTVSTVQAVELDEHEGLDEASLREHEEVTKIKNVGFLQLGRHQMGTWYFSPLPKELIQGGSTSTSITNPNYSFASGGSTPGGANNPSNLNAPAFLDVLYVCEFTFRMFARPEELQRFQKRIAPEDRHPPGNEIYRNGNLAMFEVDGLEEKIYCQNLCYIAKLFLDHKTLMYDVDIFLFYVLCEVDDRGFHPVGYYSKEKYSEYGYNLACILSFPAHQRKGYGRFLIAFSYELSKKEEKVGSPEKPMSDLGQQAYKPYWVSSTFCCWHSKGKAADCSEQSLLRILYWLHFEIMCRPPPLLTFCCTSRTNRRSASWTLPNEPPSWPKTLCTH